MIEIWHNMMWPRYKAEIFSALFSLPEAEKPIDVHVYHIFETDRSRQALAPVDPALHHYPFTLLFSGERERVRRFDLLTRLVRRAIASRASVVVLAGYDQPEYWLQLIVLKLRGKRVGVFCDSTINDNAQMWWKSWLKTRFFRSCHTILCYGQRSGDYVAAHGVDRARIQIGCQAAGLPSGYDPDVALAARLAARNTAGTAEFLYVGRLAPEKGLDDLIAAFASVAVRVPQARLTLVGGGPDEANLRADVNSRGLAERVNFAGSRLGEELTAAYRHATCLVLPSRREPWGLVVNEALAQGVPAIVSDRCGCVPELIDQDITGGVVPVGDVGCLATEMIRSVALFSDTEAVARACIARVGRFSPVQAARNIAQALARAAQLNGVASNGQIVQREAGGATNE